MRPASRYGTDCSRKRAGLPINQAELDGSSLPPAIRPLVRMPPAALDPPPRPTRKRPLIYIYDMPANWTTLFLQYRGTKAPCTWRTFEFNNMTMLNNNAGYSAETMLHELLMQVRRYTLAWVARSLHRLGQRAT